MPGLYSDQINDNCRGTPQASIFFSFSSDCNVQTRVKINDLRNAYCLGCQNIYPITAAGIHEAWASWLVVVMVVVVLVVFRGALLWVRNSHGEELFPGKHHQSLWQLRISFPEPIKDSSHWPTSHPSALPPLCSTPLFFDHTGVYFLFRFWPVGL